jgi:hypothetical protein
MPPIRSFRGPQTIAELLDMMESAKGMRAANVDTGAVDDAIRSYMSSVDPESLRISQMLREMSKGPEYSVPVTALNGLDVPAIPGRLDDMDAATLKSVNKANNSYMGLESGRTLNLRNQNTPLNQIRREDILSAAQDSIASAREAAAQEDMARKLAAAALGGGGLMVADSLSRMQRTPMMADEAVDDYALEPLPAPRSVSSPADPMEALLATDIPIEESDAPILADQPVQKKIATDLPLEQLDLVNDDPMATADLVQESRPIPATTPKIAMKSAKAPTMSADQAAMHFSGEARKQIAMLNQYRRQGMVDRATESKMLSEIQHLHGLANEARRSAGPTTNMRYR